MKDINENVVATKSMNFAIRMVKLIKYLHETKHEYNISKQIFKSGTSIGANVREGIRAQSPADFISKMNISLKEASETEFWIELLKEGQYINEEEAISLQNDCVELIKLLTSIIISTRKHNP